ncbi:MAG: hypothetical protein KAG96_00955 [Ichthyobacteriaceae bacterium]|nr:hypothetical protein [Ichthyobacteriaceae bacterium]
MKTFFDSKTNKVSQLVWLIFVILMVLLSLNYPNVGVDGSYYISIARDVFADGIPYYKMAVEYNPLAIYFYGIPYLLTSEIETQYFFLVVFAIQLISVAVFYKVLTLLKIKQQIKTFTIILFMLYSLFLGGISIYLEPLMLLFMLLTTLFLFKKKYFLSGVFLFLSFYTKQYALAFAIPIFYWVVMDDDKRIIKNFSLFKSGFFTVLILMYVIHFNQIDFWDYLKRLVGIMGVEGAIKITGGQSVLMYLASFVLIPTVFIFVPFSFYLLKFIKIDKYIVFFILAFLSTMLSIYFSVILYYFYAIIPWSIFILAIALNKLNYSIIVYKFSINKVLKYLTIYTVIVFGAYGWYSKYNNTIHKYNRDIAVSKVLVDVVPKNSKVYLKISPAQYYYGNYRSANYKKLGYTFPRTRAYNTVLDQIEKDSYLIFYAVEDSLVTKKLKDNYDFIECINNKYNVFKKVK